MEAITREEQLLNSIATKEAINIDPITREEQYLAYIAGLTDKKPEKAITRKEMFYDAIAENGTGGGGGTAKPEQSKTIEIVENGDYEVTPDSGKVLSSVTAKVNVPDRYEEGFQDGQESVPSKPEQEKTVTITENGTTEVTPDEGKTLSKVTVETNVPSSGGNDELIKALVEGGATEIILPDSVSEIKKYAFYQDTTLTNIQAAGLTSIGDRAFQNCSVLALTELPAGLTSIGTYAFDDCTVLALTELPAGLTSIGDRAFQNCSVLALTELPAGLTSIGTRAFQDCTNLTTITFKGKPTNIANNAFDKCTNLTTINVPWAEGAVANAPWGATNATINYNYTGV